jgi:hypothetical protein
MGQSSYKLTVVHLLEYRSVLFRLGCGNFGLFE